MKYTVDDYKKLYAECEANKENGISMSDLINFLKK